MVSESMLTTYQKLSARFAAEDHKTKTIGGTGLTYVDGETVVSRLNEVLGFDGWSFEVKSINVLEDEVWATGKLTVYSGDRVIVREQAGGQIINRKRDIPGRDAIPADGDRPAQPSVPFQRGAIIELSNDIKGAVTDCLKKCATLVGIGLYLYDPTERREVEQEMREARRSGPKAQGTASTSSARTTAPSPTAAARGVTPEVDAAAQMTGAPEPPVPAGYFCVECEALVKRTDTVHIPKKRAAGSPMVDVAVAEFAPVCEERLGGFHCGPCYTKKWTAAA